MRSELKGKEQREKRQLLMKKAGAIYQASTASEARTRLQTWVLQWQEYAPDAVATLQRDFEATVLFYH
jgi:transposase-like protein